MERRTEWHFGIARLVVIGIAVPLLSCAVSEERRIQNLEARVSSVERPVRQMENMREHVREISRDFEGLRRERQPLRPKLSDGEKMGAHAINAWPQFLAVLGLVLGAKRKR